MLSLTYVKKNERHTYRHLSSVVSPHAPRPPPPEYRDHSGHRTQIEAHAAVYNNINIIIICVILEIIHKLYTKIYNIKGDRNLIETTIN